MFNYYLFTSICQPDFSSETVNTEKLLSKLRLKSKIDLLTNYNYKNDFASYASLQNIQKQIQTHKNLFFLT